MERSFMLSERIWPMHAEYRITQVLVLHPPLPMSTYLYNALVKLPSDGWLLEFSTRAYASHHPELFPSACTRCLWLLIKMLSSTHFHSLCCFFPDAVTSIPSPCPATATLPRIHFCFYNSSASLLMAAICSIFFCNIVSFRFISSFMCFWKL